MATLGERGNSVGSTSTTDRALVLCAAGRKRIRCGQETSTNVRQQQASYRCRTAHGQGEWMGGWDRPLCWGTREPQGQDEGAAASGWVGSAAMAHACGRATHCTRRFPIPIPCPLPIIRTDHSRQAGRQAMPLPCASAQSVDRPPSPVGGTTPARAPWRWQWRWQPCSGAMRLASRDPVGRGPCVRCVCDDGASRPGPSSASVPEPAPGIVPPQQPPLVPPDSRSPPSAANCIG